MLIVKRKLCPTCKTGADSYSLDLNEPVCPYLLAYKDGKCAYYKKIKTNKSGFNPKCLLKTLGVIKED